MDYEKFKEQLIEDVKQNLEERGSGNINLSFQRIEKTNESYDAITATPEGGNIGANVNIGVFFEAYEDGVPYENVVDRAAETIQQGVSQAPTIDVAMLSDYEQMKDKLIMEVVSAERNAELLEKIPHQEIEDMAVVYRFVLESNEEGRASILVTNQLLDKYEVTPEQLHADAMENSPEIKPAVIQGMTEVMVEMMGPDAAAMFGMDELPKDEMMYVASVPDKIQGAGVLAYQDFMDQAAERVGGDFFVLPSSIHEILLVKDDGNTSYEELKEMVVSVNATQLRPEEKLTDSVYHYDSKDHVFELAEKFEARMQEKEADISSEKEEKGSVLKDLKDKEKEVAKKAPAKDAVEKVAKSKGGEAL